MFPELLLALDRFELGLETVVVCDDIVIAGINEAVIDSPGSLVRALRRVEIASS